MVEGVYPKDFICSNCKWSVMVKTTDECFIVCTNENIKISWPDYDNCKYYEEECECQHLKKENTKP